MSKVIKAGMNSKFKTLAEAQNAAGTFGVVSKTSKVTGLKLVAKDRTMKQVQMNKRPADDKHYIMLNESGKVYKVNHYDRSSKKYSISPVDDIYRETFVKSTRLVYIGFEY
jgi:hypothetical protein